jgi:hypothetical protein
MPPIEIRKGRGESLPKQAAFFLAYQLQYVCLCIWPCCGFSVLEMNFQLASSPHFRVRFIKNNVPSTANTMWHLLSTYYLPTTVSKRQLVKTVLAVALACGWVNFSKGAFFPLCDPGLFSKLWVNRWVGLPAFCHLSHISSPFCSGYFVGGVLQTVHAGWPWTRISSQSQSPK